MAIFVDGLREPTKEELKSLKIWLGLSKSEQERLMKLAKRKRKKNGK